MKLLTKRIDRAYEVKKKLVDYVTNLFLLVGRNGEYRKSITGGTVKVSTLKTKGMTRYLSCSISLVGGISRYLRIKGYKRDDEVKLEPFLMPIDEAFIDDLSSFLGQLERKKTITSLNSVVCGGLDSLKEALVAPFYNDDIKFFFELPSNTLGSSIKASYHYSTEGQEVRLFGEDFPEITLKEGQIVSPEKLSLSTISINCNRVFWEAGRLTAVIEPLKELLYSLQEILIFTSKFYRGYSETLGVSLGNGYELLFQTKNGYKGLEYHLAIGVYGTVLGKAIRGPEGNFKYEVNGIKNLGQISGALGRLQELNKGILMMEKRLSIIT